MYTMVMIGKDEAEVARKRETLSRYIPRRGALIGTPDQLIEELQKYADVGCQYAIFRMPDWTDLGAIELFAERVIPALANA